MSWKNVLPSSILVLLLLSLNQTIVVLASYTNVDASQAKEMIDSNPNLVILDVRTWDEYISGHIKNATLISVYELEGRLSELDSQKPTLVYCRSGGRSVMASQILVDHGFIEVYNMVGGILAWIAVGYSIVQIEVPKDYAIIQAAINAANEGDIIFVSSGTYYENVVVNKTVALVGENNNTTIISGGGKTVVSLKANNTKIKGFTVQNGSYGIQMYPWTNGHIVSNNIILNNEYGIAGHYDCVNVKICDNVITSNNVTGIEMLFSHSIISNNLISDNGKGEFQEYSAGIQICTGVNSKVIYCVDNTVFGNTIENNRIGIWATQYSEGNFFFHNNFIGNTRQVYGAVSNNTWDDGYPSGGNYWSDGTNLDANGDALADTAYIIDANNRDRYPLMSPYWYWSNPISGDLNRDMIVDMKDVSIAARAFGSYPNYPRWNPIADLNGDYKVDMRDIYLVIKNFGKTI